MLSQRLSSMANTYPFGLHSDVLAVAPGLNIPI